ncbi:hypothetical protein [Zooshikella ganghwensis]|uniref:hypothetical protein n=1 Tax=Zooshikella ganghwensis TaxID=202772 RepID=UPI00105893D1|nr:hypothetical protein [Zooshikella ganghwensis]
MNNKGWQQEFEQQILQGCQHAYPKQINGDIYPSRMISRFCYRHSSPQSPINIGSWGFVTRWPHLKTIRIGYSSTFSSFI